MEETREESPAPARNRVSALQAEEVLRNSAPPPAEARDEKKIPLVWRIFGGTILSIAALIAVTLYQQLFNKVESLSDVLVKKEEFFDHRKGTWDQIAKLRDQEKAADGELANRCTRLEQQARDCEDRCKEMAQEMKQMRDMLLTYLKEGSSRLEQQVLSSAEENRRLLREIQELRGRLTSVEQPRASGPVNPAVYQKKP